MSLLDLINQKRKDLQSGGKFGRAEKLSHGKNLIRILPGWDGPDSDNSQMWGQHFIKGADGTLKAVYPCVQTNFNEPCPVCEAIAQGAAMTSDEETLKALKDSGSNKRALVNALYLKGGKNDNPDTVPVVLELPPSVLDTIYQTYQTYMEENPPINVFDLKEGYNFVVEKSGAGLNTEYKVVTSPKSSAVSPSVVEKIKNLEEWARQGTEADKAKAITSVRVISGNSSAAPATAARLTGPGKPETSSARLADLNADDVLDGHYSEITKSSSDAKLSDEMDDFLNSL